MFGVDDLLCWGLRMLALENNSVASAAEAASDTSTGQDVASIMR